jgi:hypothetical protein
VQRPRRGEHRGVAAGYHRASPDLGSRGHPRAARHGVCRR